MFAIFSQMTLFGDWLLYSSFRASLLVLLILAARWIFWNHMSPLWRHALWMLLIVQMLLPWTPGSMLSMDNLWTLTKKVPASSMQVSDIKPLPTVMQFETPILADAPISFPSNIDWRLATLLTIWSLVALGIASRILYMNHRTTALLKRRRLITDTTLLELLEDCKEKMNVHLPIGLVSAPGVETPMVVGFIRPLLALPERVLTEFSMDEIRHIMLHELSHVKRCDIAMNWLTAILQTLHWFNPFVWIAFKLMRSDREQACDMMAVKREGYQENIRYGQTIIKLLTGFKQPRFLPEIAGIMEDKEQMKTRIALIGQLGKNLRHSSILATAILVTLAATSLTSAQTADKKKETDPQATAKKGEDANDKQANKLETASNNPMIKKLNSIIIDHVNFEDASIQDVVALLNKKSTELDPEKKGANIILKLDPKETLSLTMEMEDVPLFSIIKYITKSAGLRYQISDNAVLISKKESKQPVPTSEQGKIKEYSYKAGKIPAYMA